MKVCVTRGRYRGVRRRLKIDPLTPQIPTLGVVGVDTPERNPRPQHPKKKSPCLKRIVVHSCMCSEAYVPCGCGVNDLIIMAEAPRARCSRRNARQNWRYTRLFLFYFILIYADSLLVGNDNKNPGDPRATTTGSAAA